MTLPESPFGGEFTSSDVGFVGIAGSSFYTTNAWVVTGSGDNIWAEVDGFHYMYLPTQGDITVTTLVNSFQATNIQARGGIMFRDSLAANSPHYSMLKLGSQNLSNTYRECYGCSSMQNETNGTKPDSVWLRVAKEGRNHKAYFKGVGDTEWTLFGSTIDIIYATDTFYIGFAVSASDNAKTELLCGTNFKLTRECAGSNGKISRTNSSKYFIYDCECDHSNMILRPYFSHTFLLQLALNFHNKNFYVIKQVIASGELSLNNVMSMGKLHWKTLVKHFLRFLMLAAPLRALVVTMKRQAILQLME